MATVGGPLVEKLAAMKSITGGSAVRGALMAVLMALVGALLVTSCGVESSRPAPLAIDPTTTTSTAPLTRQNLESAEQESPSLFASAAQVADPQAPNASTPPPTTTPARSAPSPTTTVAIASTPSPTTTVPAEATTTTTVSPPATTTTSTTTSTTTTTLPAGYVSSGDESVFLSSINGTRSSSGVAALSRDSGLDSYARWWAEQMADAGGLSHSGRGGIGGSWTISAENVGTGGNVSMLYSTMVGSSGHLSNILDSRFSHVGIGVWIDGTGQMWTAHIFAGQ